IVRRSPSDNNGFPSTIARHTLSTGAITTPLTTHCALSRLSIPHLQNTYLPHSYFSFLVSLRRSIARSLDLSISPPLFHPSSFPLPPLPTPQPMLYFAHPIKYLDKSRYLIIRNISPRGLFVNQTPIRQTRQTRRDRRQRDLCGQQC